ncbi:amidohydrolase [Aestuariibacter sp. A3R04]|uniref:amidohydrolase n=1 Tax=Aestuariibacter sp. A3R04 TaxID=2841571 RepID=UPI001C0896BE|nr:amidohydrolase [Aestuariibacter sp. A3R04]MBU3021717.1 amidohydrolase [Aestuariibacter sp. A3R04]
MPLVLQRFHKQLLTALVALALSGVASASLAATSMSQNERMDAKKALIKAIDSKAKQAQVMNDMIFSFGELGFQEYQTSKYLIDILKENGFSVEEGISGIPTAWMATWGEGEPVIALGSDIDGIPKASQKPGVAYHDPILEGAPGHGEGHNSGQVVNIIAILAVKEYMEANGLTGTIKVWPGVAEEQLGTKAYYVRDGYFEDVDAVLFSHVSNSFSTSWGTGRGNGLISVQYNFYGESAHSAGSPWRGRSALDAVELMEVGMSYRREHLRLSQRIHSIVVDGGDQPNVVPPVASRWYFFRESDYPHIKSLWEIGDKMAEGAAMMSNTTWESVVLGSAWPQHMNKAMAEDAYENIKLVGMPAWSADDIALAKALQKEIGVEPEGLRTEISELSDPPDPKKLTGGGSDDIGDISWQVPTITLRYPANIPNLPGHNWSNAVAMATPIAHKGIVAGAKAQALTLFDLLTDDALMDRAWDYYKNVQTKDASYTPLLRAQDKPAVHLNKGIMAEFKGDMSEYYYDPEKYDTYMEQLGVSYPTVRE